MEDLEYDMALFEALRGLRTQEASVLKVPPYVVFGDKTLREMATYFPQSPSALLQITGVGDRKCAQFGETFLTVIHRYVQEHNLQEKTRQNSTVTTAASHTSVKPIYSGSTHDETRQLLLQKIPINEIARRRGLTPGTIIAHIETIATTDPHLDIVYLKPPQDRLKVITAAFAQSKGTALAPVRQILREIYSYDELRLARIFIVAEQ